jgi:hypothetical protein
VVEALRTLEVRTASARERIDFARVNADATNHAVLAAAEPRELVLPRNKQMLLVSGIRSRRSAAPASLPAVDLSRRCRWHKLRLRRSRRGRRRKRVGRGRGRCGRGAVDRAGGGGGAVDSRRRNDPRVADRSGRGTADRGGRGAGRSDCRRVRSNRGWGRRIRLRARRRRRTDGRAVSALLMNRSMLMYLRASLVIVAGDRFATRDREAAAKGKLGKIVGDLARARGKKNIWRYMKLP